MPELKMFHILLRKSNGVLGFFITSSGIVLSRDNSTDFPVAARPYIEMYFSPDVFVSLLMYLLLCRCIHFYCHFLLMQAETAAGE